MKTSIISRPYCHGLAPQSLIQTHTIQYNKKLHIIFCTNIFIKSSPILPLRSPRLTESQRPVMNWNSRKYFENSYFNGKQKKENKNSLPPISHMALPLFFQEIAEDAVLSKRNGFCKRLKKCSLLKTGIQTHSYMCLCEPYILMQAKILFLKGFVFFFFETSRNWT